MTSDHPLLHRTEKLEPRIAFGFNADTGALKITSDDANNDSVVEENADGYGIVDINGTDVAGASLAMLKLISFTNSGTGGDTLESIPETTSRLSIK